MNGWTFCSKNGSNCISRWNEWKLHLLIVGHEERYNKYNKNKRISIRRP